LRRGLPSAAAQGPFRYFRARAQGVTGSRWRITAAYAEGLPESGEKWEYSCISGRPGLRQRGHVRSLAAAAADKAGGRGAAAPTI